MGLKSRRCKSIGILYLRKNVNVEQPDGRPTYCDSISYAKNSGFQEYTCEITSGNSGKKNEQTTNPGIFNNSYVPRIRRVRLDGHLGQSLRNVIRDSPGISPMAGI